jgi:hypothetical protein
MSMNTDYMGQLAENLLKVIDLERGDGTIHIAAFLLDVSIGVARGIASSWLEPSELDSAPEPPILHSAVPADLGREALTSHVPRLVPEFDAIRREGDIPLVVIMGRSSAHVVSLSRFLRRTRR